MATELPEKKPFKSDIPNASDLIDNPIIPALNKRKIDAERLADVLDEGLNAKTTVFAKHRGKILGRVDVIDHHTRQDARKDAHKLRGDYPAEKKELSGPGGQPLIPPTDPKEKEMLKRLADKLIEEEKRKVREES